MNSPLSSFEAINICENYEIEVDCTYYLPSVLPMALGGFNWSRLLERCLRGA